MNASARLAELRATAERVGVEHAQALARLDETAAARRALAVLAEAGLCAWMVPALHGGADARGLAGPEAISVRAACVLRQALAYRSAMLDVMFVMQGLGSQALCADPTAESARRWLPKVARGQAIAAFALTEPGAGSSLADVALRATRGGGGWRLDGHKTFISNAGIADFYTVLARDGDGPDDFSMFLVEAGSRGLVCERFEVLGPHPIGDVRFEGVEVGDEALIGGRGRGIATALGVLGRLRTSVAAAANGFARRALDESVRHLSSRRQFGKPLSSFQGLAFDVAEMDTRLRAAELLVDEAATLVDGGSPGVKEVARAKLFATENAGYVCDRAVQHFGGLGVKRGSVVEALYRDVRALRIYEGSSEVQKLILSKELFRRVD